MRILRKKKIEVKKIVYRHILMNNKEKTTINLELNETNHSFNLSFFQKISRKNQMNMSFTGSFVDYPNSSYILLSTRHFINKETGIEEEIDFDLEIINLTTRQIPFGEDRLTEYLYDNNYGFLNNKYSSFDSIIFCKLNNYNNVNKNVEAVINAINGSKMVRLKKN